MATLATFFKKSDAIAIPRSQIGRRQTTVAQADPFMLRALPNDDIYFYSKKIDNSRVVRQADPSARGDCWSAVGAAGVLLMLGASLIAPHAASVLAGYKLESLKIERQTLLNEKRDLEVKEAGLLSPQRLNELARARSLADPAPDQIIHLDTPAADKSVASVQTQELPPKASGNPAVTTQ